MRPHLSCSAGRSRTCSQRPAALPPARLPPPDPDSRGAWPSASANRRAVPQPGGAGPGRGAASILRRSGGAERSRQRAAAQGAEATRQRSIGLPVSGGLHAPASAAQVRDGWRARSLPAEGSRVWRAVGRGSSVAARGTRRARFLLFRAHQGLLTPLGAARAAILWLSDSVRFSSLRFGACAHAPAALRRAGRAAGGPTRVQTGSRWRGPGRTPPGSFLLGRRGGEAGRGRRAAARGGAVLSHRARLESGLTASPAASSAPPAMSGCRVFIGRLNPAAREKDVERFFKGYGRIRDIDLKRGFGFVVSAPCPGPLTAPGGVCRAGVRCASGSVGRNFSFP